ncbi:phytoene desaturase [candidate division KSB1 bacterium]|nr:phytoene desaturase [candidate division KSB1 bacterium]
MNKKVVVIGGGLGGISAALHLRAKGFHVEIFESNDRLGGKMNEHRWNEFRFDTGPTLLTMPFILDDLFSTLHLHRPDYLDLTLVDPICRYFWDDGTTIDMSNSLETSIEQMAMISAKDASNYVNYLKYGRRIYDLSADLFLFRPIHEISSLMRWETLAKLFHSYEIDPFRTVHNANRSFFHDPKIVQLFDRYTTYNGSNPFKAPATLNIIPYVEHELGGYYIKGGMYRLIDVLSNLLQDMDVKIHPSTRVDKLIHRDKKATGVIVNGEAVSADYIVCNADVVNAYNTLIDGFERRRVRLNRLEPSSSGLVFLWAVRKKMDRLAHHNLFFASNYQQEFDQIFKQKIVPEEPTIYVSISSKSDPRHAPSGHENWFVLVNTPYITEDQDWSSLIESTRHHVLSRLGQFGIDLSDGIAHESVISPLDFEQKYGSNRGSIYGISSNSRTSAFRRPPNRNRDLENLYFCGGSTHPGGGVPLTLLSGKICADLINDKKR